MDQYIFTIQANVIPQVQIWHWQTDNHAVHVALGDLYASLIEALDATVEAWQGRTQTRISINGADSRPLEDYQDAQTVIDLLASTIQATIDQLDQLKKLGSFGEVINLLEELNGTLSKTMYLLTLQ